MNTENEKTFLLKTKFRELFNEEPLLVRAPGRVNIIGEHTDYNEGFVLPAAIDKAAWVAVSGSNDDNIHLYATEFAESFSCRLDEVKPVEGSWTNYILGVVDQLQKRNFPIKGFNLLLDSDVPIGAGLSSSAAIECATACALDRLFRLGLEKAEMATIAQKAEHNFAGVMCGIMDQFASVFGKKDHVIKLDCRDLSYEYVPLKMEGVKIVLLNTNVKHSLASSEYNTRRAQCEEGIRLIQQKYPTVKSLRDANMAMLDELVKPVDDLIYRRCSYVVKEIQRLTEGCEDLKQGALKALGEKMFLTHEGLSRDYEVSCKELDFLVEEARKHTSVLGARMMGGGFGGCTINLVKENEIEELVREISKAYEEKMHMQLTAYIVQTANGASLMEAAPEQTTA